MEIGEDMEVLREVGVMEKMLRRTSQSVLNLFIHRVAAERGREGGRGKEKEREREKERKREKKREREGGREGRREKWREGGRGGREGEKKERQNLTYIN